MKHAFREFARYASLNALGMLGFSCYILADTFFIAQGLGADGLTALNLAIPIYSLVHGCGLMLGMGGATRYSICRGQRDNDGASAAFVSSVYPAVLLAIIFVSAGLFFPTPLASLLGADAQVLTMTATYLRVILLFSPAFLLNDILVCFVRNDGAPRLAMTAMLGGSFSNIVLDYIFIFPCGMGMFGAVFATGLAPVISLVILSGHFKKRTLRFQREGLTLRGSGEVALLGAPSLISEMSSGLVLLLFNFIILGLAGNLGVAGYGVVANIYLVVIALFTGLGQGIQPLVSAAWGSGDKKTTRVVYRYALIFAVTLAVVVYVVSFFLADPIVAAFNREGDPDLQAIAVRGLKLYFTAFFFSGCNVVTAVFFSSLERPKAGFVVSILRGFVLIVPLALILSRILGMDGVWLSAPMTEAITTLVAIVLYRRMSREGQTEKA